MIITPDTTSCSQLGNPNMTIALVSTPTSTTPIAVPTMLPSPPVKLVPPIITAVTADVSKPTAEDGSPENILDAKITPTIAVSAAHMANATIVDLTGLIPENFAASSFPPIAYIASDIGFH